MDKQLFAEKINTILFKLIDIAAWVEHHKPDSVALNNEDIAYGQSLLITDLAQDLKEIVYELEGVPHDQ